MYKLPELPYAYGALEPWIDALTMETHHGKHHAGYVNNLNAALDKAGRSDITDLTKLLSNLNEIPEGQRTAVRNNGGGHYNHSLFWTVMGTGKGGRPTGDIAGAIDRAFGSFENFQSSFDVAAKTRFGSGWAWLTVRNDGGLDVGSSPNQDNPVIAGTGTPILGLDVWEHAYYLKYQNRRPEYVANFWNVVDWEVVAKRYQEAVK